MQRAHRGPQRAVPAALPRHALLQPAALPAPARADPHDRHGARGARRGARASARSMLGKGIVIAKDVPGFVANRLGVYGMVAAMKGLMESDLTIDEVDALTGPLLGRAKSATFRTADITGLDVLLHVSKGLSASTGEDFSMPEWVETAGRERPARRQDGGRVLQEGRQGDHDARLEDRWNTSRSRRSMIRRSPALMKEAAGEAAADGGEAAGQVRRVRAQLPAAHVALRAEDDARRSRTTSSSVDRAIEWGYAWEAGPFQQMDALGHDFLARGIRAPGARRARAARQGEGRRLLSRA